MYLLSKVFSAGKRQRNAFVLQCVVEIRRALVFAIWVFMFAKHAFHEAFMFAERTPKRFLMFANEAFMYARRNNYTSGFQYFTKCNMSPLSTSTTEMSLV